MKCKCCSLIVEANDGIALCHYCYLRECGENLGICANALTMKEENK